jgi:adenine phosphoribosyltransferase
LLLSGRNASGGSLGGAIALCRRAGAEVVGAGVILTEAHDWEQFAPEGGAWRPIPET